MNGLAHSQISDIPNCDVYLIACKPQQFAELANDLKQNLSENSLVVSVLAGTSVKTIQTGLNVSKVVRVMPNTPTLVGAGASALYFSNEVEQVDQDIVSNLFKTFLFVQHPTYQSRH